MSDTRKFFDLCYVDGKPDGVVRCQFPSPSLAATVVKAGNSNGWMDWVNDKGEPLDVLRR